MILVNGLVLAYSQLSNFTFRVDPVLVEAIHIFSDPVVIVHHHLLHPCKLSILHPILYLFKCSLKHLELLMVNFCFIRNYIQLLILVLILFHSYYFLATLLHYFGHFVHKKKIPQRSQFYLLKL